MQVQRHDFGRPREAGSQSNDLAKTEFSDQQPQINFSGDVLFNLIKPEVYISDDIDDAATYRSKRKDLDQGRSHPL